MQRQTDRDREFYKQTDKLTEKQMQSAQKILICILWFQNRAAPDNVRAFRLRFFKYH